jgi:UDP:flavonoid glycosyltransferase YjiC (YdhE family)
MPPADRNFIFGYLAGDDARVPRVLQSLVRAKVRASLYIRQAPRAWQEKLEGTSVRLFDNPQNLNEVIGAASAVLHHGGVTTTEIALAIGRPQFLLPRYVEQGLTAEAIDKMGCGVNLVLRKEDAGECIRRALARGQYVDAAVGHAKEISARPSVDVKAMIVAACLKHLM